MIPSPTGEQQMILKDISSSNVIVDSVAGSGKTSTSLLITTNNTNKSILLLTYNAKLKTETREKQKKYELNNLEVHSFHSFCVKYYHRKSFTDKKIDFIIESNRRPSTNFEYDIIIVDEVQDMSKLYRNLLHKIFMDNNNKDVKICVLGDINQSINQFNGADGRYISFAHETLKFSPFVFRGHKLSKSFRVSREIGDFINNCLLFQNRIKSDKKGVKPEYIIGNVFRDPFNVLKTILNEGHQPSDIFVIAASVISSNNPIRTFANMVTLYLKVPVYVSMSKEGKVNDKVTQNKLIFTTIHQTKGLERKIVLLIGFDNSYFEYYKKNANTSICPNEFYVATTRAIDKLYLFHHFKNDFLPFIDRDKLKLYSNFKENIEIKRSKRKKEKDYFREGVTRLCQYLTFEVISECLKKFNIVNFSFNKNEQINLPFIIQQNNLYEHVADINGNAITMYYEYKKTKDIKSIIYLDDNEDKTIYDLKPIHKSNTPPPFYITDIKQKMKDDDISIEHILYLATRCQSYQDGYLFRLKQISNYNWLSQIKLDHCVENLKTLNLSNECEFEKEVSISFPFRGKAFDIIGFIDIIDNGNRNIYEFKCVKEVQNEHFLQLAIYAYMFEKENNQNYSYFLYNIIKNRLYQLKFNTADLHNMIEILIEHKFFNHFVISDEEFLRGVDEIGEQFQNKIFNVKLIS